MPKVNQQKNLVYRPRISGKNVTYRNSKNQNVTTRFYDNTMILPKALSKTVTGKTPNVTKSALEEALWENTNHIYSSMRGDNYDAVILERAERLIDHYAEKISEGEEKEVITQNEQFKIMEIWHKWFGFDD